MKLEKSEGVLKFCRASLVWEGGVSAGVKNHARVFSRGFCADHSAPAWRIRRG